MMKKTVIASMVLAIGLLAVPVMAGNDFGIDLASMSLEDLVSLKDAVNEEIATKGGDNVLGAGIYEVGVDIKASSFKLTSYEGSDSANIIIYDSKESMEADDNVFYTFMYYDEEKETQESTIINLKDGQILETTGSLIIEDASKSFWTPEN